MYLKVLVDNNTIIDDYAFGEPGLCFYIEADQKKILFDTGYSDIFIKNAQKYNIDLSNLDYIVLSHGHNDHTRGLKFLLEQYDLSNTTLIAHPDTFKPKLEDNLAIGSPLKIDNLKQKIRLNLTKDPYKLTDNLIYLGEIQRTNDFENKNAIGLQEEDGIWHDDFVYDDSALVYKNDEIHVITGCSHSGICNIITQAKKVTSNNKVATVIGGFHLFECNNQLNETIAFFKENNIKNLYPCHCVSFQAKAKINNIIPINEVGVGVELKI